MLAPVGTARFLTPRLLLTKLLVAIYLMSTDKGGVSASRLSQMIGVSGEPHSCLKMRIKSLWKDSSLEYSHL